MWRLRMTPTAAPRTTWPIAAVLGLGLMLAACASSGPTLPPPSELPLSKETLAQLAKKGMTPEAPIFIRIFKEESELELWKQRPDGRFYLFKTYPICRWSGDIGPKLKQGDKQAPEGFYSVTLNQLNPNSTFYLSFNLGFPNAYDRAHDRTGDFLMVHGKCTSAGCYAMTDALIEEIYGIARDALKAGQPAFKVHAFPFRMTDANLARHAKSPWHGFWKTLKEGYDAFDKNRLPPDVAVCERRYVVDVTLPASRLEPTGSCPKFKRPTYAPFTPLPTEIATAAAPATPASAAPSVTPAVAPPTTPPVAATPSVAGAPASVAPTPVIVPPAPVPAVRPTAAPAPITAPASITVPAPVPVPVPASKTTTPLAATAPAKVRPPGPTPAAAATAPPAPAVAPPETAPSDGATAAFWNALRAVGLAGPSR